jgi:acetyl-CoA carboxylase carboxyltransferase component
MAAVAASRLPVAAARSSSAAFSSEVSPLPGAHDPRPVAWFRGPVTAPDAEAVARTVRAAIETGVPVVGIVERLGLDARAGLSTLDCWGAVARAMAAASGAVPTVVVLDGPCLGGPALAVGLADVVVMTGRAATYVNSAEASIRMTGNGDIGPGGFGDAWTHATHSGVAHVVVDDTAQAIEAVGDILSFLPPNSLEVPPFATSGDPADRPCTQAASTVPTSERASYDVRHVIADVVDDRWFVELRARHGTSLVVGLARIAGHPVGVVANQPSQLAGALDIESSVKGADFVRWCDAFNLPLVTFVDTPGFRPGRDQEWRGIVRHGAKLAFAYAEATVPRVSVVLRKAYGGAYIVMDCKAMGNDCALAWPSAQIAVMGAKGAVEIVHRRALQAAPDEERATRRAQLEDEYAAEHLSPRIAAERGFIDAVIEPATTRQVVAEALTALATKRERPPRRRHENIPL